MSQRPSFRKIIPLAILLVAVACVARASIDPDPAHLKRGEFIWHPEVSPHGPLVIIISLDEQRLFAYRNGIAIGVSTISTGKNGFATPTGVYTILQKERTHYSNLYDDAPMPYMQRLTWDGVALHAGKNPGYPASHGCIRLPLAFARRLFQATQRGVTVIVADSGSAPEGVVHPAMVAPLAADGKPAPDAFEGSWDESAAPTGPVSILVSTRDSRVYVYRGGIRVASSRFLNRNRVHVGGSVLYVMGSGTLDKPSRLDPSRPRHAWSAFPIATRNAPHPRTDAAYRINIPKTFARRIYAILRPGTTVLVTDLPAYRGKRKAPRAVLESIESPPAPAPAPAGPSSP